VRLLLKCLSHHLRVLLEGWSRPVLEIKRGEMIAGHISCVNNDGTESLIPVCRHQGSSATEQLEDLKTTGISLLGMAREYPVSPFFALHRAQTQFGNADQGSVPKTRLRRGVCTRCACRRSSFRRLRILTMLVYFE
jgi:hypothetical protein